MVIYRITMEHHVYFWLNEEKQNPEGFAEFEKVLKRFVCLQISHLRIGLAQLLRRSAQ